MAVAFSNYIFLATNASNTAVNNWDGGGGWISGPGGTFNGYTNFNSVRDFEDVWLTVRMFIIPNSSVGVADGTMKLEIWHPTLGYGEWTDASYEQIDAVGTFYNDSALLGLMAANVDTGGDGDWMTIWEDNIYVDNNLATVLITDTSSLTSSSAILCEAQVPTSWADTEITADFKQGKLLSGTNYVHVIDSAGTLVETGTEVTVP